MRDTLSLMWSLTLAVGLLMMATGLLNTFVGLRAAIEGFAPAVIGLLMSAYYVGFVAGARLCGRIINRVGHIRAFGAFCALNATVACLLHFTVHPVAWLLLRAVIGFNLAGLYMVIESWLNAKAMPDNRGTLLSVYMMTVFLAMGGGQLLLNVADPRGPDLFMLAAMLLSLGLVPVALTRATNPEPVESVDISFRRLYEVSPVAVVGCVASGLITGALFGMGPVYGNEIGLSVAGISILMGALIVSGLVFQYPLGRLSDRLDRRKVITGIALCTGLAATALVAFSLLLGSMTEPHPVAEVRPSSAQAAGVFALAALFGGLSATIYPVCVAYANDYLEPGELVQAAAGLSLAFGLGAAVGPSLAAAAMTVVGPAGLFAFNALVAAGVVLFALHRMRVRWWVPIRPKQRFVALPDATATPGCTEFDPRSGDAEGADPGVGLDFSPAGPFPETQEVLKRTRRRW